MPAVYALELRAVLRARWFLAAIALSVGLVGFFAVVAARESAVIGFTGYGRVLSGVVQASLLFVPLLALFSTVQSVTGARQDGVLDWYLSYPNSRGRCFWALFAPRLAAVLVPLATAVLGLGGVAMALGEAVPVTLLARYLFLLLSQAFCFSGVGILVSATARSPEQALLRGLVVWMAAAALVDFVVLGLLLRWDLPPYAVFALAGVHPVQAGRVGILAGVDASLGVLGPVGTWLTTSLGPLWTLTYGLGWPLLLGGVSLLLARFAFGRRDL